MEAKNELTIENVYEKLNNEFSHKYSVKIKTNPFFRSVKWVEIYKNPFVSVKVSLKTNHIIVEKNLPNVYVRVILGLISIFVYQGARAKLAKEVLDFLNK